MARYRMDYDRGFRGRGMGMGYDRDLGGYGGWTGGSRNWDRNWRSDFGAGEAARGGWGGSNRGRGGWSRGFDEMDRGWSGMDRGWGNDWMRGRGWERDYDRDFGDRLRQGWNRMRGGMRDVMGRSDRGW
jgi:hypothetical protein